MSKTHHNKKRRPNVQTPRRKQIGNTIKWETAIRVVYVDDGELTLVARLGKDEECDLVHGTKAVIDELVGTSDWLFARGQSSPSLERALEKLAEYLGIA
jgi:hypothetical protein